MLNINKIISNIIQFEYTKHFNYEKKVKNNYTDVMPENDGYSNGIRRIFFQPTKSNCHQSF